VRKVYCPLNASAWRIEIRGTVADLVTASVTVYPTRTRSHFFLFQLRLCTASSSSLPQIRTSASSTLTGPTDDLCIVTFVLVLQPLFLRWTMDSSGRDLANPYPASLCLEQPACSFMHASSAMLLSLANMGTTLRPPDLSNVGSVFLQDTVVPGASEYAMHDLFQRDTLRFSDRLAGELYPSVTPLAIGNHMQHLLKIGRPEIPFRQGVDSDLFAPSFSVPPQTASHVEDSLVHVPEPHRTRAPFTAPASLSTPTAPLDVSTAHYGDLVAKSWDGGFVDLFTGNFTCLSASTGAEDEVSGKDSIDTDGSTMFDVAHQPESGLSHALGLPSVAAMSGTVDERHTATLDSSNPPYRRKVDTGPGSSRATRKSRATRAVHGNGSHAQSRPPWYAGTVGTPMNRFFGEVASGPLTVHVSADQLVAPRHPPKQITEHIAPSASHPQPMPPSAALSCSNLDWMVWLPPGDYVFKDSWAAIAWFATEVLGEVEEGRSRLPAVVLHLSSASTPHELDLDYDLELSDLDYGSAPPPPKQVGALLVPARYATFFRVVIDLVEASYQNTRILEQLLSYRDARGQLWRMIQRLHAVLISPTDSAFADLVLAERRRREVLSAMRHMLAPPQVPKQGIISPDLFFSLRARVKQGRVLLASYHAPKTVEVGIPSARGSGYVIEAASGAQGQLLRLNAGYTPSLPAWRVRRNG
jgi:hypothetical protein